MHETQEEPEDLQENMTVFIYTLSDPRDHRVRYVGKAVDCTRRLCNHFYDKKKCHRTHWVQSLSDLGLRPIMEVVRVIENSNDKDWQEIEQLWISELRNLGYELTNTDAGGRGGVKRSPETIAKMSASQKGKKKSPEHIAALTGRKQSPEHTAKVSAKRRGGKLSAETIAKMRGRKLSKEHIENMRAARTGIPCSEETKAKISAAKKGKKLPPGFGAMVSARLTGRILSDEHRKKMAEGMRASWIRRRELAENVEK